MKVGDYSLPERIIAILALAVICVIAMLRFPDDYTVALMAVTAIAAALPGGVRKK